MLGVHFAITADQERLLLAAADEDLGALLEDIEETWDDDGLKVDTDKAWDAIHRSLTDGTLDPDDGRYPLSYAVLGGLEMDLDLCIVYKTAAQVREVADALQGIDQSWLRQRFDAIDDPHYGGALDDGDFRYTGTNFVDVRDFYQRAAAAGRAVIFTAT